MQLLFVNNLYKNVFSVLNHQNLAFFSLLRFMVHVFENKTKCDLMWISVPSQPLVMCRQCPGYRSYMSQVLLTTSSNCWFAGLPSLPAVLSSAKPAGEEEAAKLTGEQPSTSSEATSGVCPLMLHSSYCVSINEQNKKRLKFKKNNDHHLFYRISKFQYTVVLFRRLEFSLVIADRKLMGEKK